MTYFSVEISSLFEGIDFHSSITRTRFEELCADMFHNTLDLVEKALRLSVSDKTGNGVIMDKCEINTSFLSAAQHVFQWCRSFSRTSSLVKNSTRASTQMRQWPTVLLLRLPFLAGTSQQLLMICFCWRLLHFPLGLRPLAVK